MSHILVNTLYYCKRKKQLKSSLPCAQGCFFSLILFSDCMPIHCLSGCHAIPFHQDSKIGSPLLKKNQIDKNYINMFQLLLELSLL